jgi:hypothetical protein
LASAAIIAVIVEVGAGEADFHFRFSLPVVLLIERLAGGVAALFDSRIFESLLVGLVTGSA